MSDRLSLAADRAVVRDNRLPPFLWISRDAMASLRREFDGKQRPVAVSIYTALAAISSEQHRGDHGGIVATRKQVADEAGVAVRALDRYIKRFQEIGLLEVTRRREGALNLPNEWTLVEPQHGGSVSQRHHPSASRDHHPGVCQRHPLEEGEERKEGRSRGEQVDLPTWEPPRGRAREPQVGRSALPEHLEMIRSRGVPNAAEFSQLDPDVVRRIIDDYDRDSQAGPGALNYRLREAAAGRGYKPLSAGPRRGVNAQDARKREREARIASLPLEGDDRSAGLAASRPVLELAAAG